MFTLPTSNQPNHFCGIRRHPSPPTAALGIHKYDTNPYDLSHIRAMEYIYYCIARCLILIEPPCPHQSKPVQPTLHWSSTTSPPHHNMPMKIINLRVPSYPLIGVGFFEPLQITSSNYGNIKYQSSIVYPHKSENCDAQMEINLLSYSSRENSLSTGTVYAIGGRWIVRATAESAEAPTLNFNYNYAFAIRPFPTLNLPFSLRHFVVGFGQAQWRGKIPNPQSPHLPNNLCFIMNHTDFDPLDKTHQAFDVRYTSSGKGPLRHVFNLIQVQRELQVFGVVQGYSSLSHLFEVQVISLAVATGVGPPLPPNVNSTQNDRPNGILFDASNVTSAKPLDPSPPTASSSPSGNEQNLHQAADTSS
ncbi:hypothetical protein PCASD_08707 [Puccinia coronata f. sp. avenae]|uniref:Uncharacterized protein n=1 Tax=Puccinia coronata f. sp. avenae TaxID=200324 RepID=A0A2N5UG38_9BASI|nr:hypothetical protein PCASD_08707 [Puccinia coronata f. sp. avenae]